MTGDSRGGWRGLVRRTPLWILVLAIAAFWTAFQVGMRLLGGKEVAAVEVAVYGATGVAFGTFILWAFLRARAKEEALPPGSPTAMNIKKAISTGQLPEHASAELWEPRLITLLIEERRWAWMGAVVFGLATVLGIFVLFDTGENPWLGVVCTVEFLGLAVGFPLWVRHRRPRIQRLLDQFPKEESLWR